MRKIVSDFGRQLTEAIGIAQKVQVRLSTRKTEQVLVCGLGGSGIGGKIVGQIFASQLKVPFATVNDYEIPAFVGSGTLVIASSYSGTTEETIATVLKCKEAGAEICVITSGGELKKLATENGWNCVLIPGGEQPRAMLVYSLVQIIHLLVRYGLIPQKCMADLAGIPAFIAKEEAFVLNQAEEIARGLKGKIPIIYSASQNEAICVRFRQQLNENCKVLCWHHVLPEMTHNELVGWAGGADSFAVVYLSSPEDNPRTKKRWEFCREVINKKTSAVFQIESKGDGNLQITFYLIHFTDWVSVFLSEQLGVDPVEVEVIGKLKGTMAKLKN